MNWVNLLLAVFAFGLIVTAGWLVRVWYVEERNAVGFWEMLFEAPFWIGLVGIVLLLSAFAR